MFNSFAFNVGDSAGKTFEAINNLTQDERNIVANALKKNGGSAVGLIAKMAVDKSLFPANLSD
jgi:hypothetical protein